MPIGIRAIRSTMAQIVMRVTPKTESGIPFKLAEDPDLGVTPDIIEEPGKASIRNFVIRPTQAMPGDDGEAGTPAGRLAAPMAVQIVYPIRGIDRGRLWMAAGEDAAMIQRAMQVVVDWDRPNTGIISIDPGANVTREDLSQGDRDSAIGLTIPFIVRYRENPLI